VLDGRVVADGDELTGTGTVASADVLPDSSDPNGYFGSYGAFCAADRIGIVVLDDVVRG
jgi:hypothetical protein